MNASTTAPLALPMDSGRVNELRVELIHTLRTVLREVCAMERTPEMAEAMASIERGLNRALLTGQAELGTIRGTNGAAP